MQIGCKLLGVWIASSLLLSAGGCNSDRDLHRIDAIPSFSTDALYLSERLGMSEEVKQRGLELRWNGPSNGDAQRQIELIDAAVKHNSYGIVLDPRTLYAANMPIATALEKKIPVVVLLNPLPFPPSPHMYYVLEDTQESAKLIAQRLQQQEREKSDVVLMGSDPLTPGGVERFTAVESTLRTQLPQSHVVDRIAGPPSVRYFEVALEGSLTEHPRSNVILAMNSRAALAAVAVVRALHLEPQMKIIAIDQTVDLLLLLRRNELDALVAQDTRTMGKIAVNKISDDRHGRMSSSCVYVKPALITSDNIDTEPIQQILQMN